MTPPRNTTGGVLSPAEIFWRDQYHFLKDRGYTLRRRYEPDWTPSWADSNKAKSQSEDAVLPVHSMVMDATRSDGTYVVLKRINTSAPTKELIVGQLFSSTDLVADSRNHCVPIIDIIERQDSHNFAVIVMPLLYNIDYVVFETIGEVVGFIRQIFEGLQFMHCHNVAHGDCKYDNILADIGSLYDHPPHPNRPSMRRDFRGRASRPASQTSRPIKYHLIDFDLSNIYESGVARLELPPWGGDKTVPEHLIPNAPPCDPFPVDVYCIANVIRQTFLDGREILDVKPVQGFEFMRELISDMVDDDPKNRPSMDEVVDRFNNIIEGLSEWTLRSPIVDVGERYGIVSTAIHWTKQLSRVVWGTPAIPEA